MLATTLQVRQQCPLLVCSSSLGSANYFKMLWRKAATGVPDVSRLVSLLTVRLVAFCDPISTFACMQHVSRDALKNGLRPPSSVSAFATEREKSGDLFVHPPAD